MPEIKDGRNVQEWLQRALLLLTEAVAIVGRQQIWFAKIVETDECWAPNGMAEFPRLTQELLDEAIELTQRQTDVLTKAKGLI